VTAVAQLPDLLRGVDVELPADLRTACDRLTREILYLMG